MNRDIITTRAWAGSMLNPSGDLKYVGWGAGFHVGDEVPDAFGLVIHPTRAGARVRLRIWQIGTSEQVVTEPFAAPADEQLLGTVEHDLPSLVTAMSPDLNGMVWIPLPPGVVAAHGAYAVEATMLNNGGAASPFRVGVVRTDAPWDWSAGFMTMADGAMRPAKLPWALAWGLASGAALGQAKPILPRVEVEAQVLNGFDLSLSALVIRDVVGPRRFPARKIRVPKPRQETVRIDLDKRVHKLAIPYRWYTRVKSDAETNLSSRQFDILASNARYDLVSVDRFSGEVRLTLGEERALDPEEYPAKLPTGHLPLYHLLTTCVGIEPVRLVGWHDMVREGEEARHLHWLEYCRQRLPNTMRKLRTGEPIRLVGYGDSITALGGRSPDHVERSNGPTRDMMAYLEYYGNDFKAALPLHSAADGGAAIHHRIGWNWFLKGAIEHRSACTVTYDNWGIAGTSSGDDFKDIDGVRYPNVANPDRIARMLESHPDLVTIAVGMNDIGEPEDTYANVIAIGETVRKAGAEIIIVGPCRPNPKFNSRDDALWRLTHDRVIAAALDLDAAYLATWEIYGDGNEGAAGIARSSHCAASMGNHPGPRELAAVGRLLSKIIP